MNVREHEMMKSNGQFAILPVEESSLAEVARFLWKCSGARDRAQRALPGIPDDCLSLERRLVWLLLENPAADHQSHLGWCVRDDAGRIRGLNLRFPGIFLAGDKRVRGLGSGGFFVEPEARTLGFYLFKKYLGSRDYSFFFATTCNARSAVLWEKLGGSAVPNSDVEYVLPLRLDILLPEALAARTSKGSVQKLARVCGQWADSVRRLFERRPSRGLSIEPCQDWQKLSELFHRHRRKEWATTDRSPEYLEWRYGRNSEPCPSGAYLVRNARGQEGWFALGTVVRGHQRHIQGLIVLDEVWPRENLGLQEVLPSVRGLFDGKADAIFLRPRAGHEYGNGSPWMVRRKWAVPSAFFIAGEGNGFGDACRLDLACADGDTALPISPRVRRAPVQCGFPTRLQPN